MRLLAGLAMLVVGGAVAQAGQVQLLNPEIFGHPTSDAVDLLYGKKGHELEPSYVQVDIKCGRYRAATVTYPESVTLDEARASLDALYADYRQMSTTELHLWRVEDAHGDPQLVIQLAESSERGGGVRIVYLAHGEWVETCYLGEAEAGDPEHEPAEARKEGVQ